MNSPNSVKTHAALAAVIVVAVVVVAVVVVVAGQHPEVIIRIPHSYYFISCAHDLSMLLPRCHETIIGAWGIGEPPRPSASFAAPVITAPSALSPPDKTCQYHEVRQVPAVTDRHVATIRAQPNAHAL